MGLLKEEQFRKGSQARARSLLARLKQELTEWVGREGAPFDASLLGADLQQLFQVAQESGGDWERARTELMHLCTQAPAGPAGGSKQRRRSSPTAQQQASPEMPRVSPTPSSASVSSSDGGEPQLHSHSGEEEAPAPSPAAGASSAAAAAAAPAAAAGKRDPFARVLSPSDSLGTSTSGSSGGNAAPMPVVAGMGGFPGLSRLANAGTLTDMLVRGTSIPVTLSMSSSEQKPGAVAAASKKDGGGGPTKENVAAKNE